MTSQEHGHNQIHGQLELGDMESTATLFRIGNHEDAFDLIRDGKRYLFWAPNGHEAELMNIAGWARLPHVVNEYSAHINLPEGTRTASSVLSGLEAWSGEKAAVIDFITGYVEQVHEKLDGQVDTSLTFETVGVAPDTTTFVAPPHHPTNNAADIADWYTKLIADAQTMLDDQSKQEVLSRLVTMAVHIDR